MTEKSLVEKASEFLSANVGDKMTINLEQLCQAVVDADEMLQMKAHINYSNLTGLEIAWVRKYSEVKDD